jgi:hypothetical protein
MNKGLARGMQAIMAGFTRFDSEAMIELCNPPGCNNMAVFAFLGRFYVDLALTRRNFSIMTCETTTLNF